MSLKLSINKLKPNPDNPRVIKDDKYKKLVESLKGFPEMADIREIVVNKDYMILGGNMRFRAMQEAGWKEAPVKIVDLPEDKQKEFIIKDNNPYGEWDWDLIASQYELEDLENWGIDLPYDMQDKEVVEDEAPPIADVAISKLGEVYQLGRHRLMCGDSTDFGQISDLVDGVEPDLLLTDPPYGINAVTEEGLSGAGAMKGYGVAKRGVYSKVLGDDNREVFIKCWEAVGELTKHHIVFGGNYYTDILPQNGHWLVWLKKDYDKQDTFSDAELLWTSYPLNNVKTYRFISDGMFREGDKNIEGIKRSHPTQKPVGLLAKIITDHKADTILDLFGGSGSTLIACEQLDRTCYMMEIDPKYIDVIRKRYWKFVNGTEDGWEENTIQRELSEAKSG